MSDKKVKRVLHITEMLSAAGIESFIMNVYRNIDRNKIQFDFLVLRDKKEFYDDEVTKLGGRKYFVHSDKSNTLLRVIEESKKIEEFLINNHYDIVHIHYTTPLRAYYLKAAKNAGVPVRIYHSHSAEVSGKSKIKLLIYNHCKKLIDMYATHCFACSEAAARWVYSNYALNNNKTKVIYNGIDTERFLFKKDIRKEIRNDLAIDNEYVLINTGRFTEQKNQSFILDIMHYLRESEHNVKLLFLGDGPLKEECFAKAKELGIDDSVSFLGVKSNVQDYLFASDCYVMPSLYEGLPVAGVEAECTGLPCIYSKNITDEVEINSNVVFMDLDQSVKEWAKTILSMGIVSKREEAIKSVKAAGYDIYDVTRIMQEFYLSEVSIYDKE